MIVSAEDFIKVIDEREIDRAFFRSIFLNLSRDYIPRLSAEINSGKKVYMAVGEKHVEDQEEENILTMLMKPSRMEDVEGIIAAEAFKLGPYIGH
jgi:hypothetical protein